MALPGALRVLIGAAGVGRSCVQGMRLAGGGLHNHATMGAPPAGARALEPCAAVEDGGLERWPERLHNGRAAGCGTWRRPAHWSPALLGRVEACTLRAA